VSDGRLRRSAIVAAAASAGFASLAQAAARADVGQSAPAAFLAVTDRAIWAHVTPRVMIPQGAGVRIATWERDAGSEEKRYVITQKIAATDSGGTSIEERYERSTRKHNYVISPVQRGDLASAISPASLLDFERAKPAGIVKNGALLLAQRFFRGKRWAYAITVSDPDARGARNVVWSQFSRSELGPRTRAAKACAGSGDCGEAAANQ
jgi:hypothetical protein